MPLTLWGPAVCQSVVRQSSFSKYGALHAITAIWSLAAHAGAGVPPRSLSATVLTGVILVAKVLQAAHVLLATPYRSIAANRTTLFVLAMEAVCASLLVWSQLEPSRASFNAVRGPALTCHLHRAAAAGCRGLCACCELMAHTPCPHSAGTYAVWFAAHCGVSPCLVCKHVEKACMRCLCCCHAGDISANVRQDATYYVQGPSLLWCLHALVHRRACANASSASLRGLCLPAVLCPGAAGADAVPARRVHGAATHPKLQPHGCEHAIIIQDALRQGHATQAHGACVHRVCN